MLFFGLLAAGMPIFLVLGMCAGMLYIVSGQPLIGVAQVVIDKLNSTTLMSLPLFVMAAAFMRRAASPRRWSIVCHRLAGRHPRLARPRHGRCLHAVRRDLRLVGRDGAGDGHDPAAGDDREAAIRVPSRWA